MERKSYLTSKAFRMFLGASILTALSCMLGSVVDGVIVSHMVDYNAMSATSLSKPILQANYTFYQLIGLGASILVAKALGENDKQGVYGLFTLSILILGIFGLTETFIGIFCPDLIIDMVCKDAALHDYVSQYFIPMLIGTPTFLAVWFLGGFTAIDGCPRLVSVAMVVSNVMNLLLDVTLIKVFDMSVMGSSIATVFENIIAIAIMLSHYTKGTSQYRFASLTKSIGKSIALAKDICSTGLPFAVSSVCMTIYLFYTQAIISTNIGTDGLFIFSVMLNIMIMFDMFITGACTTMQQLAALQIGLSDTYGHRMTVFSAFKFLNISLGISCVLMSVFPGIVAHMFDCPANMLSECCYAVRIYGFAFWMSSLLYLLMVNYKLLREDRLANFISLALNLSVIPVMWFNVTYFGELLLWSNLIAYILVFICVALFSLYLSSRRRQDDLVPLFLLPRRSRNPQFDISFDYTSDTMHSSFDDLSAWLKKQELSESVIFKVRVIAEELMSNIIRHSKNKNKNAYVDVRLLLSDDGVNFSIIDDGAPFNPIENKDKGYGLMIANGVANSINYKYQFGQNMTVIVVHK